MEAVDGDKTGTRNSHISYEIINGNYDKKFAIDKNTGTKGIKAEIHQALLSQFSLVVEFLIG